MLFVVGADHAMSLESLQWKSKTMEIFNFVSGVKSIMTRFLKKLKRGKIDKCQNVESIEATANLDQWYDQVRFEKWAFGYSPVKYDISDMHAWNSHHGDIYTAQPNESIHGSVEKMKSIWKHYDEHTRDTSKES